MDERERFVGSYQSKKRYREWAKKRKDKIFRSMIRAKKSDRNHLTSGFHIYDDRRMIIVFVVSIRNGYRCACVPARARKCVSGGRNEATRQKRRCAMHDVLISLITDGNPSIIQ